MFGFQMRGGPVGFGSLWSWESHGVALSLNSFVMERERLLSTWFPSGTFPSASQRALCGPIHSVHWALTAVGSEVYPGTEDFERHRPGGGVIANPSGLASHPCSPSWAGVFLAPLASEVEALVIKRY